MARTLQLLPDGSVDQLIRAVNQLHPQPGDTIQLGPGSFWGGVKIPRGVRLAGRGPDQTLVYASGTAVQLEFGAMLEDVSVQTDAGAGVFISNASNAVVGGCQFVGAGPAQTHILVTGSAGVTIRDSRFDGKSGNAIRLVSSDCAIERCVIKDQCLPLLFGETSTVRISSSSFSPAPPSDHGSISLLTSPVGCSFTDCEVTVEAASFACERRSAILVAGASALSVFDSRFEWFERGGLSVSINSDQAGNEAIVFASGITSEGGARVSVDRSLFRLTRDEGVQESAGAATAVTYLRNGVSVMGSCDVAIRRTRFEGIATGLISRGGEATAGPGPIHHTRVSIDGCEFAQLAKSQIEVWGGETKVSNSDFAVEDDSPMVIVGGSLSIDNSSFRPVAAVCGTTDPSNLREDLVERTYYLKADDADVALINCSFARTPIADCVQVGVDGGPMRVDRCVFDGGQVIGLLLGDVEAAIISNSTFKWEADVDPWYMHDNDPPHSFFSNGIAVVGEGTIEILDSAFCGPPEESRSADVEINAVGCCIFEGVSARVVGCEFAGIGAGVSGTAVPDLPEDVPRDRPASVTLESSRVDTATMLAIASGGAQIEVVTHAGDTVDESGLWVSDVASTIRVVDGRTGETISEIEMQVQEVENERLLEA